MAIMRNLDQYLKKRNKRWHYQRRVPVEYTHLDKRGVIRKSLKTESLEVARARRDALVEADNQYWMKLSLQDRIPTEVSLNLYRAARRRAMARGFIYSPAAELADAASLPDIMNRIQSIPTQPEPDRIEADALLGLVERPSLKVSEAMELYCEEIAISDLLGKSDEQKKSWRKVKMRALKNFIKVNGDLRMAEIEREHARKYYNWWGSRIAPKDGSKPLSTNSANRDIGNMRKLFSEFWSYEGEEDRDNPFRNLSFAKQKPKDRPHIPNSLIRSGFLKPGVFDGLNPEATLLIYALIETGCRPSELSNILPDCIFLDEEVPFVRIQSRIDRQVKSHASWRDIPLVGCSLEAMKRAPEGFPRYRDKGNLMSAAIMKALRSRDLLPTRAHTLYSLRHSFEKRMLEGHLDYGLRCTLMGHKNNRPEYGDGGSMKFRRDELSKIAHPISRLFTESLPTSSP